MGNLLSVHAEIFFKEDNGLNDSRPALLLYELLHTYRGRSYNCAPILVYDFHEHNSLRISYGDKYEPRQLIEFQFEFRKIIDQIYARTFDETGDWDHLIFLPNESSKFDEMKVKCRYEFDQIKFKLKPREELTFNNQLYKAGNIHLMDIRGFFNSKSDLNEHESGYETTYPIDNLRSLHPYSILEIESPHLEILLNIIDKSDDIMFMHRNLTVHRKIDIQEYNNLGYPNTLRERKVYEKNALEYNNGKYDIYSSGWPNCANVDYLDYVEKRKKKNVT